LKEGTGKAPELTARLLLLATTWPCTRTTATRLPFVSPTGLFEWTAVLPFGVTNGPAQFSRPLHGRERDPSLSLMGDDVVFYLDDLFVASTSVDEHIDDLMALGRRMAAKGLMMM